MSEEQRFINIDNTLPAQQEKGNPAINQYFRFFGDKFKADVRCCSSPRIAFLGYVNALIWYWRNGCEGIKGDEAYLQRVCELTDEEWVADGYYISRELFHQTPDGLYHHCDLRSQYWKASKEWEKKSLGGVNSGKSRRLEKLPPTKTL